jgi:glycosyltransferase involved in cell wall biosynthesis
MPFFFSMRLSIIFPAYNEEKGIQECLQRTKKVLAALPFSSEIIVVDDGSKDKTFLFAKQEKVNVIKHTRNKGYGAALLTGFSAAKGEILCCLDADGTYPPEEIPKLYSFLVTHDVEMVSGARLLGACKGMPTVRKFGNHILSFIASILLGKKIYDLASGMRLIYRKTLFEEVLPLSQDLDFTVRMTLTCAAKKIKFKEIPIAYHDRKGISKLHISTHGNMFLQSILYITRDYNPLRLFVPISFGFIIIGIINIVQLLLRRLMGELSTSLTNGLVITVAFILFGIQVLFFGILADMIVTIKQKRT